jgi:hypothetical protein
VDVRDTGDDAAVDLLGERREPVAAAQAGLDVRNRDVLVEGSERAAHRRRGVSLDDHPVRPELGDHLP